MTASLTFNDIDNRELRAWNRASVMFNLAKDKSAKECAEYADQFSQIDRDSISAIFNEIQATSYEKTKARISRLVQTIERTADAA